MRKSTLFAAAAALWMCASAQDVMVVTMTNGTQAKFTIDDIEEITFEDSEDAPDTRAVDLGLPSGTKWASMNLGAENPSDFGYYFAWGDVTYKASYSEESYKYAEMTMDSINGTEHDAAKAMWKGKWTVPTLEQWNELLANTTIQKSTVGGKDGLVLRSKVAGNTNSIFLPFMGQVQDTYVVNPEYAWYWSATQGEWNDSKNVAHYFFGAATFNRMSTTNKRVGLPIRAVQSGSN